MLMRENFVALFRKRNAGPSNEAQLQEIEASVQSVRRRLSNARMPIDELFRMLGEDDRQLIAAMHRPRATEFDEELGTKLQEPPNPRSSRPLEEGAASLQGEGGPRAHRSEELAGSREPLSRPSPLHPPQESLR